MIGSFSIGNAAPHLGSIFGAKGAAAEVFETIDNVRHLPLSCIMIELILQMIFSSISNSVYIVIGFPGHTCFKKLSLLETILMSF